MSVKPILFNGEMVRAILDGRKTVTRRVIKPRYKDGDSGFRINKRVMDGVITGVEIVDEDGAGTDRYVKPPYEVGDVLWVRETFSPMYPDEKSNRIIGYVYKADPTGEEAVKEYDRKYPNGKDYTIDWKWHPSIHMPKEAARIWLRVTEVGVERLQDITLGDVLKAGVAINPDFYKAYDTVGESKYLRKKFQKLWDSTVKKSDLDMYGWEANPWVFRIEFERYENGSHRNVVYMRGV